MTRSRTWLQLGSAGATALALTATLAAPAQALAPSLPEQAAERSAHARELGQARWGDDTTGEGAKASAATGTWSPEGDLGSMHSITSASGAQRAWKRRDAAGRPVTGKDVTVAVVDTGVSPVAGLDGEDKLVNGPDLSFESQTAGTRYRDGYGHGTHMAGIIAGRDGGHATGRFLGVAPDAEILNMKVATADGGADVTQVIAAIDWVVQHRRSGGMDVRVINLSYGTASEQSYREDALARAVENAWEAGIVVVAAAGNDGETRDALTMPAADPYVIAVGASDHGGTARLADDTVTGFTNPGTTERRPDLLAPGKSVVSLRVPGSYADRDHPEGRVTGDESGRFFRGSGTSQATAVVSGAVALLLQARPELTPDQVKALLLRSARSLPAETSPARGAGLLDVDKALSLPAPDADDAAQTWPESTGLGPIQLSRGGSAVVDPLNGAVLTGEVDALGGVWDGRSWSQASAAGTAWVGGDWLGRSWSGDGWATDDWSGRSWSGRSWSGRSWSGLDWQGRSWSSDVWTGRSWSGDDWVGRSWSAGTWLGRSWSGDGWRGRSWSAEGWAADHWAADDWAGRSWSAESWLGRSWSGDGWLTGRSWS